MLTYEALEALAARKGYTIGPFFGLDGGRHSLRRNHRRDDGSPMRRLSNSMEELEAILRLLPNVDAEGCILGFDENPPPSPESYRAPLVIEALLAECARKSYALAYCQVDATVEYFCLMDLCPGEGRKQLYLSDRSAYVMHFLQGVQPVQSK